MNIFIDNKSGAPIYDKIYSQIKAQIIGGDLLEDESLPSIRSLAKDLRISVITTKRAYEELEKLEMNPDYQLISYEMPEKPSEHLGSTLGELFAGLNLKLA